MAIQPRAGMGSMPQTQSIGSASGAARGASAQRPPEIGFQALLDRLGQQAELLRSQSESVEDAEGLSRAMERAQSTVQDAMQLSERLLESVRQAEQLGRSAATGSAPLR